MQHHLQQLHRDVMVHHMQRAQSHPGAQARQQLCSIDTIWLLCLLQQERCCLGRPTANTLARLTAPVKLLCGFACNEIVQWSAGMLAFCCITDHHAAVVGQEVMLQL